MNQQRFQILKQLEQLGDDVLIGVAEVSAMIDYSIPIIRQRRVRNLPEPLKPRRLRWRLGTIREFLRGATPPAAPHTRPGRPTKSAEIARRAKA
jgi:hypothetical protein